eukprot:TRINITY_DN29549_c0_g1_i1.p1 TRINITY_DN29549_c0_g1~~TRINITY_DN29549_c0_g1_i1.p1  ORF type:complete len:417 (+),score=43.28 TRINITY_DN29549_c0_g1_i1:70-1320(+)
MWSARSPSRSRSPPWRAHSDDVSDNRPDVRSDGNPEDVAGPALCELLRWWGVWPGDLRRVAPADELRTCLQRVDVSWRRMSRCLRLDKGCRPRDMAEFTTPDLSSALLQLDGYVCQLEREARSASVHAVVGSADTVQRVLLFAEIEVVGAAISASRCWRAWASADGFWQKLLLVHFPGSKFLLNDMVGSKRLFARRVELARAARLRDKSRDDADFSLDFSEYSRFELRHQSQRYRILLELAYRDVRVTGIFDFEEPEENDESEDVEYLFARVPRDLLGGKPLEVQIGDGEDNPLRASVTLLRKSDQKLLVLGDNLAISKCSEEEVEFESGSSAVTDMVDTVLAVVAHEPVLGLGLNSSGIYRHYFRHTVSLCDLVWDESSQRIEAFESICIGMEGRGGGLWLRTMFAAWDYLSEWK